MKDEGGPDRFWLIPHPSARIAAVGVVAGGSDPAGPSRSVAGDGPGIAFNAEAVTVAAQVVAAEASGA